MGKGRVSRCILLEGSRRPLISVNLKGEGGEGAEIIPGAWAVVFVSWSRGGGRVRVVSRGVDASKGLIGLLNLKEIG